MKRYASLLPGMLVGLMLLSACTGAPNAVSSAPTGVPSAPASPTTAPTEVVVPFKTADAHEQNKRLAHSVNMGNTLEAPTEGAWGLRLEEQYIQLAHDAGFSGIRVPVSWSSHAAQQAPYTIEPAFLARVDQVVRQGLSRNLIVVLDMHNYDALFQNPAAQHDRFLAIWKQVATHFKEYSSDLLFEIMNEPHDIMPQAWNKLQAEALAAIRESNPTRTVVVGPVEYYGIRQLQDLKLPAEDQHLIVTVHYYSPYQFTHQGAEWVPDSSGWLGTTWKGSSSQKVDIEWDLDKAAEWAKQAKRPMFLGEFGAYSKADMESRARWTAFVARSAEKRNISWAYWEFGAGFGVYDPAAKAWRQPLLDALMPKASSQK